MSATVARMDVSVFLYGSTKLDVRAYECPPGEYGRAFASIHLGDLLAGSSRVELVAHNVESLDRLMDAVADARTGLLRVLRDADGRQPELVAS